MLQKTAGVVLRSVKYGETSLVTTIFTAQYGVQSYMVQGVRSTSVQKNRAVFFQPAMLLDMVVYQQPNKNLQRIKEFHPAHIYRTLQEDVVKNTIALFSAELLLRLLPEHAPVPAMFDFSRNYFIELDKLRTAAVANFPLFFIIHCGRELGFGINGKYGRDTPYLNLQEGGFSGHSPHLPPYTSDEAARSLSQMLDVEELSQSGEVVMNADIRVQLIDWHIQFLQRHSEHMGIIRSLSVLRAILH